MIDHLPPKDRARLRKIAAPATTGDRWGSTMVTVALTGEQWAALLARIVHSTPHKGALSKLGEAIYSRAAGDLQMQLVASSDSFKTAAQADPLPDGVEIIGLDDPAELHRKLKDILGD